MAELDKCQVLCKPCHRAKTSVEQKGRIRKPSHGTLTGYYKHKCRCDLCRAKARDYRQQRKKEGKTP